VQAEVVQGGRGQAGGVPVNAEHDDPVVIPGDPGQPGVAAGIEAPFQVIPFHHGRTRYLALGRPLGGRPDVDEHRSAGHLAERLLGRQPLQAGARGGEYLADGAGTRRPAGHHAAGPSVPSLTRPPGVSS
jgi:hypothetical protein